MNKLDILTEAGKLVTKQYLAAEEKHADRKQWIDKLDKAFELVGMPEFQPTGSRRFNYENKDSDFDFFIKESDAKKYENRFLELGFAVVSRQGIIIRSRRHILSNPYDDKTVYMILAYQDTIHVQIIKDEWYDIKVKAQDVFESGLVADPSDKTGARKLRPFMSKRMLAIQWNAIIDDLYIPWSNDEKDKKK